jgi:hypothetical protein
MANVVLADGGPVPRAFVAATLTEYSTPGARPRSKHEGRPSLSRARVVQVAPPGLAVAV